jgi:GH25 family lysozyme M1 (1,4-beta-N-acetylmuramidase)
MVWWIHDFSETHNSKFDRYPVIYTTTDWWRACIGNYPGFGVTNPLWIASFSGSPGFLPAWWGDWTLWKYFNIGVGGEDYFNGDDAGLKR